MTVKDSVELPELHSGSAKPAPRDAVGAEIPVTVHASRTAQGLCKNLPPVHEDTRTVIVLQQGAVVRLTASLMTGETVVLTNRMTGADVLCRVGKIKSQPGIQHYVDLEFMQRAPGFWGDALAAVSAPMPETPAAPASAPSAGRVISLPYPPAVALPMASVPPAPAAVIPPFSEPPAAPVSSEPILPAAPVMPEAAPSDPVHPAPVPLSVHTAPSEESPAAAVETLRTAALAEPVVTSRKPVPANIAPVRGGLSEPTFGASRSERAGGDVSGSRKNLLVAAAAAALVLGAGAYWFYSQQNQRSASAALPAFQPGPTLAAPEVTPDLTPVSTLPPDTSPSPLDALAAETRADPAAESRPDFETASARVQAAPAGPVRTSAPAARRSSVPIGQLKAPSVKTAAARMDSSEPPPPLIGAMNLADAGATSALLAAESAGPAPPPVNSARAVGGQLQQPQLISSTAAVYPPAARMQRIQGTVVLDALVDETGRVAETKVIAGPAPLVPAAQEAVRNWRYRPAQLNGKPIAIHTKVSVRFALQ